MLKTLAFGAVLAFLAGMVVVGTAAAAHGKPNFGAAIFADGETFGTKGTTDLPAPNAHNEQSFDGLYKIVNGDVDGQLAVAEAAPGNPDYNGGRWIEYEVEWVSGTPVLLTSYADIQAHINDLQITATGNYFQCPLLPDKGE